MVEAFGCRSSKKSVRAARRGSEDCKLRDALCIRAAPCIPDRRLDRAGSETALFAAPKENDGAAAGRILGNLLWRTRRIRAAVLVSSCARGIANIRSIERFLDSASFRSE